LRKPIAGLLVLAFCCTCLAGQKSVSKTASTGENTARANPASRLALKGATILPIASGPIVGGMVLIEDGKITAVGKDLPLPEGVEVVDLSGKYLYPGLIDAGSNLALGARDKRERKGGLEVKDGLDPFDPALGRVLAGGVTAAFVSPLLHKATTGILGSVIRVMPGETPEGLILKRVAAVRASLGVSSGYSSDTVSRWKDYKALDRTLKGIKSYTESRKKYVKDHKKWKKDLKEWRKKVGIPLEEEKASKEKRDQATKKKARGEAPKKAAKKKDTAGVEKKVSRKKKKIPRRPKKPRAPRKDPVKEALQAVLLKKIPLRVEAHRVEDIRRALELAREYGFRLVLEGATEAGALAEEIKKAGASVVAGPLVLFDSRRLEYEKFDPATPGHLRKAEVPVALASASSHPLASRFMALTAAYAAGHGMTRDQALRAVTLDAARILGVEDVIGSIEKGKNADLVVADRHPLATGCRVTRVFMGGKVVYSHAGRKKGS